MENLIYNRNAVSSTSTPGVLLSAVMAHSSGSGSSEPERWSSKAEKRPEPPEREEKAIAPGTVAGGTSTGGVLRKVPGTSDSSKAFADRARSVQRSVWLYRGQSPVFHHLWCSGPIFFSMVT